MGSEWILGGLDWGGGGVGVDSVGSGYGPNAVMNLRVLAPRS
jgi:hypothetical protein